ncbi:hypothetical protein [Rhodococcoides yunnanense]|uniref:hypothetical protein n=1 Tax=Rhodococcoides yunnanense TaxID=278209 RepID=UPI0009352B78|nr:hypothetical protein [Rhodococcus yunnanensis]
MPLFAASTALTVVAAGIAAAQPLPLPLPDTGSFSTGSSGSAGWPDPTEPGDPGSPNPTGPGSSLNLLSPNAGEPVLGVPIETLADNPAGFITLDGVAVPDVTDTQNLLIAVVDAKTRALRQYGTQPNNSGGLSSFNDIVAGYVNTADTIVVISGMNGVRNASTNSLVTRLANSIGASLSRSDLDRMEVGAPFSMIGKAGAPTGVAYTRVGTAVGDRAGGDITGLLRWNPRLARYDFTPPPPLTYSTRTEGDTVGGSVTTTIGAATYTSHPSGPDGFVIRGFEPQTLVPAYEATVVTSNPTGNRELSTKLTEVAGRVDNAGRPYLVIVQSFGRPRPVRDWQDGADALVRIGGSRLNLLSLNGTSDYSLVGGRAVGSAAVEMGTLLSRPGPATGYLGRSHDFTYLPQISGPTGTVDSRQIAIMYQPSYSGGTGPESTFPTINSAAESYIGSQVRIPGCTSTSIACTIREKFRTNYNADWATLARTLAAPIVRPTDAAFTQAEFDAALAQLRKEVDYFNTVKTYYDSTQRAMGLVRGDAALSAKSIGDAVARDVAPSPTNTVLQDGFKVLSSVMGVVTLVEPALKDFWGPINAIYSLTASIGGLTNGTALANPTQVRIDQLSQQIQDNLAAATYGFTSVALVMVSDYGKLEAAYNEISSERWKAPVEPEALLQSLEQGIRTWFATKLTPVAFPWLVRGTPPGLGPNNANGLICGTDYDRFGRILDYYPWSDMPANAQMAATWSFGDEGRPAPWSMFITRQRPEMGLASQRENSMSQSLANTLFGGGPAQLEINLYDFFSPRYFGPEMHQANHNSPPRCDLF